MNRTLFFMFFVLFGVIENYTNAQVSVLPEFKKEETKVVVEKTVTKEVVLPYDSLRDFNDDNYKSQVGQTLFLTDRKKKNFSNLFFEDVLGTKKYEYMEKGGITFFPDYDELIGKFYYVNRLFDEDKLGKGRACFELIMQEEPHDTIFFVFSLYEIKDPGFVNVGYVTKLKEIYKGKELIVRNFFDTSFFRNLESGEKMPAIPKGTKFLCTDIMLNKDWHYPIAFLFSNPNYPDLFTDVDNIGFVICLPERYLAEQQEEAAKEKAKKQKEDEIIKKYGKANVDLMRAGKVKIGWTTDMCAEAWGAPKDINITTTQYGSTSQWVYGNGNYLYFENGKLVSIQR